MMMIIKMMMIVMKVTMMMMTMTMNWPVAFLVIFFCLDVDFFETSE